MTAGLVQMMRKKRGHWCIRWRLLSAAEITGGATCPPDDSRRTSAAQARLSSLPLCASQLRTYSATPVATSRMGAV